MAATYYYVPGGSGSLDKANAPAGATLVQLSPYMSTADKDYIARANAAARLSPGAGATDQHLQSLVATGTAAKPAVVPIGIPGTFQATTPLYNRYPTESLNPSSLEFVQGYGDRQYLPFMTNQGKSALYEPDKLDPYNRSGVYLDPNAQYRITDRASGKELYSGTGAEGLKNAFALSQKLSAQQGAKANWGVETYDPASQSWNLTAEDKVDPMGIEQIAGMALPIAAAFIPGLGTIGSILAATAAGGAGAAISDQDILKGALMGGLGAAGGSLLGPAIQGVGTGAAKVATTLGKAAGTGLGTTAGGLATGKNLGDALLGGALAGAGSYLGGSLFGGSKAPSDFDKAFSPDYMSSLASGGNLGAGVGQAAGSAGSALGSAADDAITVIGNRLGSNIGSAVGSRAGTAIGNLATNLGTGTQAAQPPQNNDLNEITVTGRPNSDWLKILGGPLALGAGAAAALGAGAGAGAGAGSSAAAPATSTSTPANPSDITVTAARQNPSWLKDLGSPLSLGIDAATLAAIQQAASAAPATSSAATKASTVSKIGAGLKAAGILSSLLGGAAGGGGSASTIPGGLGSTDPIYKAKLPTPGVGGAFQVGGMGPNEARTLTAPAGGDWTKFGMGSATEDVAPSNIPQYGGVTPAGYNPATLQWLGPQPAAFDVKPVKKAMGGAFAVGGPGDGRSDDIPAQLSDGEYVMDAETVALLGNGSSKAGAAQLDKFRANIRKHKGRNLARGKFSVKAKQPDAYLSGGRS